MAALDIAIRPIHLGPGARAEPQPAFSGSDWYADYTARHAGDGAEGRLVSQFTFERPWPHWEMHPHGSEVVLCISGALTLHQEHADGSRASVRLEAGRYAINEAGTWHTADCDGPTTALFITAGLGTLHRPR
jgi:quercetin dioxygenase-like cupin family protein